MTSEDDLARTDAITVDAVIIGRNEGARLVRCLVSVAGASAADSICGFRIDRRVGCGGADGGGDVLMRLDAVRAVGGYRDGLIAGEEPELYLQLRRAGGEVWRVPTEMTRRSCCSANCGSDASVPATPLPKVSRCTAQGVMRFYLGRLRGHGLGLIEYK